jgi:hypothetical protein
MKKPSEFLKSYPELRRMLDQHEYYLKEMMWTAMQAYADQVDPAPISDEIPEGGFPSLYAQGKHVGYMRAKAEGISDEAFRAELERRWEKAMNRIELRELVIHKSSNAIFGFVKSELLKPTP